MRVCKCFGKLLWLPVKHHSCFYQNPLRYFYSKDSAKLCIIQKRKTETQPRSLHFPGNQIVDQSKACTQRHQVSCIRSQLFAVQAQIERILRLVGCNLDAILVLQYFPVAIIITISYVCFHMLLDLVVELEPVLTQRCICDICNS